MVFDYYYYYNMAEAYSFFVEVLVEFVDFEEEGIFLDFDDNMVVAVEYYLDNSDYIFAGEELLVLECLEY